MNRTACMAVTVRADGVSEAIYNGQRDRVVEAVRAEAERETQAVREEMRRQRAELEARIKAEADRAELREWRLNRELALKLDRATPARRRGPVRRALRAIEGGWAMAWAICHCWAEIGERLGLWVIERDGQNTP